MMPESSAQLLPLMSQSPPGLSKQDCGSIACCGLGLCGTLPHNFERFEKNGIHSGPRRIDPWMESVDLLMVNVT